MKTMTCKQLGGACEESFTADTFEEIAEMSKQHGVEMIKKGDQAHLTVMEEMKTLMKSPNAMQAWFKNKRMTFNSLPENEGS